MRAKLHFETVSPLLKSTLQWGMNESTFDSFRLVGGTALSLHRGHRMSIDIDLFSDAMYGSLDFNALETTLRENFNYLETSKVSLTGMGRSYFVGNVETDLLKLDIY